MAKTMLLMDSEDSKTPIMSPPMKNEIKKILTENA